MEDYRPFKYLTRQKTEESSLETRMGKRNKIKSFCLDFQNIVNVKCGFCTLMHVLTEENDNDCLQFKENWQFSLKRIC